MRVLQGKKNSAAWWHDSMSVLSTTELYAEAVAGLVNSVTCM